MRQVVCGVFLSFTQIVWCASDARLTLRVTDDVGGLATNAIVAISTLDHWEPGEAAGKGSLRYEQTKTDTNGMATLTVPCKTGKVGYGVYIDKYSTGGYTYRMNGVSYYSGGGGTYFSTNTNRGKWQPWNPLLEVQIKRVLNPIPMYAKHVKSGLTLLNPQDRPAYDLVMGDWVKPYGKGMVADFIFAGDYSGRTVTNLTSASLNTLKERSGEAMARHAQRLGTERSFEMQLSLAFSNEGDGIQCVRMLPSKSVLRLPYSAPDNGYEPTLIQEKYLRPYDRSRMAAHDAMRAERENNKQSLDEDLNYFFQVRTKRNDKGEILSALHGKIYGPIEFWTSPTGMTIEFVYYLNPVSNDRNTEFDLNKNLFKDLPFGERPQHP